MLSPVWTVQPSHMFLKHNIQMTKEQLVKVFCRTPNGHQMPNDSGVKWLKGQETEWIKVQVSLPHIMTLNGTWFTQFPIKGKHQSLIFIFIRHLLVFAIEHSANTSDNKGVEWASTREVPFADVTFHRSQWKVSDSLIGNDKPNKSPSIKNNTLVKD